MSSEGWGSASANSLTRACLACAHNIGMKMKTEANLFLDPLDRSSCTIKPVLSGHLKIDKTKVLMENGSLMKVKSIAECSHWNTFDLH